MPDQSLETIEMLHQELADVERQLMEGDIDEATATRLTDKYTAELDALITARSGHDDDSAGDEAATKPVWLTARAKAGILIMTVAILGIAVFAVTSLVSNTPSGVEGVAQDALMGSNTRDLSTVTNEELEEVVAENPGVIPMRLALARRYFEAGEFDKALEHYLVVLSVEQHPEALANVGWMTYLSGYDELAVGYLEAAVERDPTYLTARWFLGNVYASLGRKDEAIVMLVSVVSADETPQEIKNVALELISRLDNADD